MGNPNSKGITTSNPYVIEKGAIHVGQFIHPLSFSVVQPFLQPRHYNFFGGLGLPIPLRISRHRIPIPNPQFPAVSSEIFTVKLKSIIKDLGMRNSKPGDNVPPDEPFNIHVLDISKGLSLHPFSKIIRADKKPPTISYSSRKEIHYIQAPLNKWPRARQWI